MGCRHLPDAAAALISRHETQQLDVPSLDLPTCYKHCLHLLHLHFGQQTSNKNIALMKMISLHSIAF